MGVAVTTSGRRSDALEAEGREAAAFAGVPFVPRPANRPLATLLTPALDALIVLAANEVALVDQDSSLPFAEGLARLRIRQVAKRTGRDRLIDLGELRPGDRVLDCTLGLGADAQVAAWAVGRQGSVTALESSPALALLARHGLRRLRRPPEAAVITVRLVDATAFLAAQSDRSFDVVLVDPMFRHARKASPAFGLMRRHANHAPFTREMIAEASRVSRRVLLVKGGSGIIDLPRLGLRPEPGRRGARVEWARVPRPG